MSATEHGFDHKAFLAACTSAPGVYQMLDDAGTVLYVGKARNLRKRLASYFRSAGERSPKTRAMVAQIADIRVAVTHTEAEALLLEANLIKRHRPRYNVLLRDDKSYPYIFVSNHEYPRLGFHRGARKKGVRYFGPYPSAVAVRETLNLLQKLFLMRQCEDSVFAHRSRPCLQHQIGRCTAPCVALIDPDEYAADVQASVRFLEGRSEQVIGDLVQRMEAASAALQFERAARLRDQIAHLRQISEQQYVAGGDGDADIFALAREGGAAAVQIFFVRHGQNLGNSVRYPKLPEEAGDDEIMAAILAQYYAEREPSQLVLVSHRPQEPEGLAALLEQRRGGRVRLAWSLRGDRARWVEMAQRNAELALKTRLAGQAGQQSRLQALAEVLQLPEPPARMECFDISHTQGEGTVASCVVFGPEGPLKSDYRRFNIAGIAPSDDYAAMHQALDRRFARLKKEAGPLPDILFIDGGQGQVNQALDVLRSHGIEGMRVVGVAKGPERRAGLETLVLSGVQGPSILPAQSSALHLIQQIRDEAHRFAITGHRLRRAKARRESRLEEIPGLGPKRRGALLRHFGGLRGISRAGVEELAKVPGISHNLAQAIYEGFHEN
ncbi:Excinuclease ABC subunit C [Thioalkalivibrio nitratireducens DSM 14787]|uniref:UvrABC system protein C n=1 Tax=Thioalkalivibrio nitratireducens (strain DSM 14787 / UNIQEM 213 / ALEN2) TaxID=1255043 RepID=L0DTX4_THIND|nr:excinuclease ABC subunit UvrC [Thioalkalivibrio nitratireducens]AGA33049.1 Excinuclease ABC subunit C [Thioalkalivibrio nitratireducens DSM 14787]